MFAIIIIAAESTHLQGVRVNVTSTEKASLSPRTKLGPRSLNLLCCFSFYCACLTLIYFPCWTIKSKKARIMSILFAILLKGSSTIAGSA